MQLRRELKVRLARCFALAAILVPATWAAAQAAPPAGGPDAAVTPFVDEATMAVARVDVASIKPEAAGPWMVDLMKIMNVPQQEIDRAQKDMNEVLPKATKWVADFTKAGGKTLYVVAQFSAKDPYGFAVVPLGAGADAAKLTELLRDPMGAAPKNVTEVARPGQPPVRTETNPLAQFKGEKVGNALVFTHPAIFDQVKGIEAGPRPELDKALAAGGNAAINVALIPPGGVRVALPVAMPKLPPELGGAPTTLLTQGIMWANLAVDSPPKAAARLTIQAADAETAKKLRGLLDTAVKSLKEQEKEVREMPEFDEIVKAVSPEVVGDQLKVSLDTPKIQDLARKVGPAIHRARGQAVRVQSASNLRQITVGVMMYANEHKGELPKDLQADLKPYLGTPEYIQQLFTNPQQPDRKPGYVYVRPADKITQVKATAQTVLAYESFDKWGEGINVAFADGHVEFVKDQAQFQAMLKGGGGGGAGVAPKLPAAP